MLSSSAWGPPAFRGAPRLTVLLPLQQKAQQQVESGQCCSSTSSSNTRGGSSSNGSTSSSSSSSTARNSSSKVEARVRGSEHPVSALTNNNSSSSSKVYRQPEGFIDFVFKWGVGNAFRAQNANRYRPVHVARERSVSLPKDYFASPLSSVSFEPLNEAWEVVFYENQKKSSKPFPVKKWGVKRAKMEAIAFAEQMQAAGRLEAPKHESDVPGVFWDGLTSSWVCLLQINGLPTSRSFSAETHGFQQAKLLAVQRATLYQEKQEQQQQQEEQQQKHWGQSTTPAAMTSSILRKTTTL